ncbi:MAG: sugar ABC transporter permease, partial [Spirochaetia bacterium]|nr:sugar ABC transporter permease [Spirochaetia bacterium]
YVGMQNYTDLFTRDLVFSKAIKNTLFYAFVSNLFGIIGSVTIAYYLNKNLKGISLYRILIYLPSVIPMVAIAMLFRRVFSPNGLLNQFLRIFGVQGPMWMLDASTVLWALAIMSLWGIGGGTILLLAGMKGISDELYEAAEIDGASSVQSFWKITLPMLSPVIFFNLIMGLIGGLQTFGQVYVMTQGSGGPDNASMMIVLYLYNNAFKYYKMGYASAMAWVLFAMVLALTLLVFKSSALWVYYESEVKN